MALFFLVAIILFSLLIFYQDLKERRVSVWILFGISVFIGTEAFWLRPFGEVLKVSCLNLAFLVIEFLLVALYYFIRYKGLAKLVQSIGGADLWLILVLALSFSTANFILFLTLTLFLSLFIYMVYRAFSSAPAPQIPLAGFIALFYCIGRIIMYFYSPLAIWNDDWIMMAMDI